MAGKSGDDGEDGHIGEFEGQTGIGASAGIGTDIAVRPVQAEIVAEAIDVTVRARSGRGREGRLVFVIVVVHACLHIERGGEPIPTRLVLGIGRGRSVAKLGDDISRCAGNCCNACLENAAIHEGRRCANSHVERRRELHIAIISFDSITRFVVRTIATARNCRCAAISRIGRARREIGAVVVRVGAAIRPTKNRRCVRRGRGEGRFEASGSTAKADKIDNQRIA